MPPPSQVNWIAEAPMRSVALSTWSEWSGGLRTSSLSISVVDPARPWRDQTALFRRVTLAWRHGAATGYYPCIKSISRLRNVCDAAVLDGCQHPA
jgi:hypothetical protein